MKSIRAALLLGSGEDVPRHPPALNLAETFIICADGGAVLARKWGVAPNLILGDLDSLDGETLTYWQEKGVPVQRVPAEKDETDLELAVDFALEQGVEKIILVGAWGSRVDHAWVIWSSCTAWPKGELPMSFSPGTTASSPSLPVWRPGLGQEAMFP